MLGQFSNFSNNSLRQLLLLLYFIDKETEAEGLAPGHIASKRRSWWSVFISHTTPFILFEALYFLNS